MLYIAFTLGIIASFCLGYYIRSLRSKIEALETTVKQKVDKPPEEAQSTVIDPYNEVQTAQFELEQMNKKLNP